MIVRDYVDAIVGLQYGDEGKGKITGSLVEQRDYDYTVRYNGGPNAGHSIHKNNGAHYALHQLPSSIAFKKPGYIAPGCVLDIEKLMQETSDFMLVEGFDPLDYLHIHPQVPLIKNTHKHADSLYHYKKQGSTCSGIAPAYSDYYNRTADLFESYEFQLTSYDYLVKSIDSVNTMLLEGAQGYYLNPESGNYPHTTSSNCSPASASATLGFSPFKFRNVIGVAKCYETRSGEDPNFYNLFANGTFKNNRIPFTEKDYQDFETIQTAGKEFGVTTGRKRAVRFLCMERLVHAIQATGTNIVVLNKWDVLDQVNIYKLVLNGVIASFETSNAMFNFVKDTIKLCCPQVKHVIYSASPKTDIDWDDYLN